jgi:hypothetical protein
MCINLCSPSERAYNAYQRREKVKRQELVACFSIVIEAVHPAHWTDYPPSPREMLHKAWLLGVKPS